MIKYTNNATTLLAAIKTLATAYRPVIFTAKDDNSVGDTITGSTGNPTNYYAADALWFSGNSVTNSLQNMRIAFAKTAILAAGTVNLTNVQIINCQNGVMVGGSYESLYLNLRNVLMANVLTDFNLVNLYDGSGIMSAENVTFANTYNYTNNYWLVGLGTFISCGVSLTNCVLANVNFGNISAYLSGSSNGFYPPCYCSLGIGTSSFPFQSVGAGNYYLTNGSPFRNAGTTNIGSTLLTALQTKTTHPPVVFAEAAITNNLAFSPQVPRDTNSSPDLGYHYDPIDYAVSGVSLSNAIVSVYPGTVIAAFGTGDSAFGLNLSGGMEFLCKGLATNWNRIVAYNTVQEQSGSAWQAPTNGLVTDTGGDSPSALECRFTDWSVPAQDEAFLVFSNNTSVALRDCQFHGGSLVWSYIPISDPSINNCLFERVKVILNATYGTSFSVQNNLFWHGTFNFAPTSSDSVVQNNLFDQTTIPDNSATYSTYIGGYNAYVTNCDQLQPGSVNDLILINPPIYFVGPLGNYYQPTNSPLMNAGSTNADALGLYDYTVVTNLVGGQEIKETNSLVDIGYHYVAVGSNGVPLTTYTNGLPDYLVTSSTDPIPDWWEYIYFGNLDQATNGDYDNDGTNNLTEYQNGTDPNKISFSFSVPSQYVTNNLVPCVITVLGGMPTSIATLVDSTNFASATWTAYISPNITINLGSTQGAHDVWIGLRGLPANAYQTWEETTLILDSTSPSIIITNPAAGVSFNASRVNVSGSFTAASLHQITVNDIVAFVSGTNFEAVNVPLAPGSNLISAVIENLTGITNAFSISIVGITNSDGSMNSPVQLQATPVAGFAPLTVTFSIETNVPGTIQQVIYDFNGDDIADLITNNLLPLTYTYTNGEYFPVVMIQTTAGTFSSSGGWNSADPNRLQITVQNPVIQLASISVTDPVDLKWTGTNLFVLTGSSGTITVFDTNGSSVGTPFSLGAASSGLDVDANGNVYVALTYSNQVWKFFYTNSSFVADTNFGFGGFIGATNGASGTTNGEFNAPFDVAVSPDGGTISVSDSGNNRIQQFDSGGNFLDSFGTNGTDIGQFNAPNGLTYDSVGYLYIADSGNSRIILTQDSLVLGVSGTNGTAAGQFNAPVNVSVSERGIYVADAGNNRVQTFNPIVPQTAPTPFTARSVLSTNFSQPAALAAVDDPIAEKFYVADTGHNRVVLYALAGDDPTPVWNRMTNYVVAGDISGAVSSFSSVSTDNYRQAFLASGIGNLPSVINQIGTLILDYVNGDEAECYFTETSGGQTITFPVHFVRENGVWKILEF